jgi:hypothetical protein
MIAFLILFSFESQLIIIKYILCVLLLLINFIYFIEYLKIIFFYYLKLIVIYLMIIYLFFIEKYEFGEIGKRVRFKI